MIRCPKCEYENSDDALNCVNCHVNLKFALQSPEIFKNQEPEPEITENISSSIVSIPSAIAILRFFAWVDLIAAIIGAIWIWFEFGTRPTGYSGYFREANPLGIAIGIAVLLQGIFTCAFFLVFASIGENLIFIKEYLYKKQKKCPKCAEEVKIEAQVCRFCGYNFPEKPQEPLGPSMLEELI